jgi:hypothetical protein
VVAIVTKIKEILLRRIFVRLFLLRLGAALLAAIFVFHIHIVASEHLGLWTGTSRRSRARCMSNHLAVLVHKLKVVPAQEMGDRRELRPVARSVVVELE